ncbi:MAG: hypothetical protein PHU75_10350 [Candidatus Nanopelagicales bacterium]|nr:hypothetical protein [Candidatus Nanopelagicales bacterium]
MTLLRRPAGVIAVIVLVSLVFLVLSEVGALESARIVLVVGIESLAGYAVWSSLVRRRAIAADIGMALALGLAFSTISALLVQLAGLGSWGWALPAVLAAGWWVIRRLRGASRRPSAAARVDRSTGVGLATALVLGLGGLAFNLRNYPLAWDGSWGRYHNDMLFFEALSTSLADLGPLHSIFMSGGVIRYHWLVYAWSGELTQAAGASPFVVLTRVLPLVTVLATSTLAIAWARRLTRVVWVPALAVVLILIGGYVGATYGTILNFDSPSQAMTVVWLLALALVVTLWCRRTALRAPATAAFVLVLVVLGFMLAGGKVSSGAVAVGATVFAALAGLVLRAPWWRRAMLAAAAVTVGAAAAFVLIVSGSADPGGLKLFSPLDRASSVQALNPIAGHLGIALGTGVLIIAIAVRWAGLVWLGAAPSTRRSVDTWLGFGFAAVSVATVVAISGGLNDTWFALAASAPLAVLSAAGVGRAATAVHPPSGGWLPRGPVLAALAVGLALSALATVLWLTGGSGGNVFVSSPRWLGPVLAVVGAIVVAALLARMRGLQGTFRVRWLALAIVILVGASTVGRFTGVGTDLVGRQPGRSDDAFTPKVPFVTSYDTQAITSWTSDQVAAAAWLRANTPQDALVATNITLSPLVPALTQRPTYASGITYQAPYGLPRNLGPLLTQEWVSWWFLQDLAPKAHELLCSAGVDYLWVDPTRTKRRDWSPYATIVHQTPDTIILRLDPSRC